MVSVPTLAPTSKLPRLYRDAPLHEGARLPLDRAAANYLLGVLRLGAGDGVLVFNGRDGEWRADLAPSGRRDASLALVGRVRAQTAAADLHLLFAPLKSARLDYVAQKAVEMGASALRPVFTRRTQASRINADRLRANAIEAAEQCGVLTIPEILPESDLETALAGLGPERLLVFCDEAAEAGNPLDALAEAARNSRSGLAVMVGPEGGFAPEERARVLQRPNRVRLSLGPRILRADTAAVAALAIVQAALGDWRTSPPGVETD